MVRGKAVATVAGLEARAGGGKDPAPILAGYDPVLVRRRTGRRMKSRAHDEVRDGPPNKFGGISPNALVPEGSGGEIASSVPAEAGVQRGHGGTWIGMGVPAEVRARAQSADDGGSIAMSVPAEARARAQTAYKEASAAAPLTMLAEPYPWRAEPVHSSAHTRAYRAYLGASPAAGDPTATPRASPGDGTCDCPSCRLLVSALCLLPEPNEGCATPCFDDPTKFCLYCAGGDGRPEKIGGPYSTKSTWLNELNAEIRDCAQRCGGGLGENVDNCGTLYDYVEVTNAFHRCCWYGPFNLLQCLGTKAIFELSCALVCDRACPEGQTCQASYVGDCHTCKVGTITYYNCSPCCDICSSPPCGSTPCGATICTVDNTQTGCASGPRRCLCAAN